MIAEPPVWRQVTSAGRALAALTVTAPTCDQSQDEAAQTDLGPHLTTAGRRAAAAAGALRQALARRFRRCETLEVHRAAIQRAENAVGRAIASLIRGGAGVALAELVVVARVAKLA